MATSRIPEVTDALVTALKAAPGLAGVPVYDGPFVTGDFSDAVYVGYDGDPEGGFAAASSAQDWAGIGARHRSEGIDITCAVVVTVGSGDIKTARDHAFTLLAAAEDTLRADPSLGLPPPTTAAVTSPALAFNLASGAQARLTFTIHIDTRI